MAKAKAEITIFNIKDVKSVTRYYLLQSSTAAIPSKPTTITPGSNWKTTEPSYTGDSTNTLYFVDLTIMSDGKTFSYSDVSKSSSYEAAKAAWNKANNAQKTADDIADNIYYPVTVEVDGNKLRAGTVTAKQINVADLFAQDIQASGSITGVTINAYAGHIGKSFIDESGFGSSISSKDSQGAQVIKNLTLYPLDSLYDYIIAIRTNKHSSAGVMAMPDTFTLDKKGNIYTVGKIDTSDAFYCNGYRIGETFYGNSTTAKAIKSGAWSNTNSSVTLPPGVYMMTGTILFAASKGGRLGARFATSDNGFDQTTNVIPGTTTAATGYVQCQWIMSVTEETKYYLQAWQSSGANVNVTSSYMKAVRIA